MPFVGMPFAPFQVWGGADRKTDPFSRRFREGISFPKFGERSILKLPLAKIGAVPFALRNREEEVPGKEKGRKVTSRGAKRKKGCVKTSQLRVRVSEIPDVFEGFLWFVKKTYQ